MARWNRDKFFSSKQSRVRSATSFLLFTGLIGVVIYALVAWSESLPVVYKSASTGEVVQILDRKGQPIDLDLNGVKYHIVWVK